MSEQTELNHGMNLPDSAVPLAVVEIVMGLDGDGDNAYWLRHQGTNDSTATVLGCLELAKVHVIENSTFGGPAADDDEEG